MSLPNSILSSDIMQILLICLLLGVIALSYFDANQIIEGKKNKKKKDNNRDKRNKSKKKAKKRFKRAEKRINNMEQLEGEKNEDFELRQQAELDAAASRRAGKVEKAKLNKKKQEIFKRTKKNNPGLSQDELIRITKTKAEKKRQLGKLAKSKGISKKEARKQLKLASELIGGSVGESIDLTPYALKTDVLEAPLVLDDDFYKTFILTQNESGIHTWLQGDTDETARRQRIADQYENHIRFFEDAI
jgi:hypothetical protein